MSPDARVPRGAGRRARGVVPPGARAECAHVGQDEPLLQRHVLQSTQVGRPPLNSSSEMLKCRSHPKIQLNFYIIVL